VSSRPEQDVAESYAFVEALVRALQLYGVSSQALRTSFARVVAALGLHGQLLATPSYVQTVLWRDDERQQRVHLSVARSGNYHLGKLVRVDELADLVATGALDPSEGFARLRDISTMDDDYGAAGILLAFMLCGVSFAVILGASWLDAAFGGLVAVASYGVSVLASRSTGVAVLQEFFAAAVATVLGSLAAGAFPGVNPVAVAICACIWFVPGFGLTMAPNELLVGNTLSGLTWLTNALVTAFKLFGGFAFGLALMRAVGWGTTSAYAPSIPAGWGWVAAPLLVVALAVLMRTHVRNIASILVGGWLVWGSLQLGNLVGFWEGTFLGAAVLVVYGSWYGRRYKIPSAVVILPCVMILVPGLAALRAMDVADKQGLVEGFSAAIDVMTLIVAIIGGSVVGDSIVLHVVSRMHGKKPSARAHSG